MLPPPRQEGLPPVLWASLLSVRAPNMERFHHMWESLLFRWLPGRQPLPSPSPRGVWLHHHWSPSDVPPPHLTRSSSPGPDGCRDKADERGRRLL